MLFLATTRCVDWLSKWRASRVSSNQRPGSRGNSPIIKPRPMKIQVTRTYKIVFWKCSVRKFHILWVLREGDRRICVSLWYLARNVTRQVVNKQRQEHWLEVCNCCFFFLFSLCSIVCAEYIVCDQCQHISIYFCVFAVCTKQVEVSKLYGTGEHALQGILIRAFAAVAVVRFSALPALFVSATLLQQTVTVCVFVSD